NAYDCCFFFFQAEDGIRDFHVTGVQTCALPISAQEKGFWDGGGHNISEKLMLIVSELGEAQEALRKDKHTDPGEIALVEGAEDKIGRASCRGREKVSEVEGQL